jgi:hypothetical protein
MIASRKPEFDTRARADGPPTDWYRVSFEDAAARLGTTMARLEDLTRGASILANSPEIDFERLACQMERTETS